MLGKIAAPTIFLSHQPDCGLPDHVVWAGLAGLPACGVAGNYEHELRGKDAKLLDSAKKKTNNNAILRHYRCCDNIRAARGCRRETDHAIVMCASL